MENLNLKLKEDFQLIDDLQPPKITTIRGVYGDHVYYNCSIFNTLLINDVEYRIMYTTGLSYDHNDYNYPSNSFELDETGTSEELILIHNLYQQDIEEENDEAQEVLNELIDNRSVINSFERMFAVYEFLNDLEDGERCYNYVEERDEEIIKAYENELAEE